MSDQIPVEFEEEVGKDFCLTNLWLRLTQEEIDPFDMICGDDISRIPETTKPDFECNKEKEAEESSESPKETEETTGEAKEISESPQETEETTGEAEESSESPQETEEIIGEAEENSETPQETEETTGEKVIRV